MRKAFLLLAAGLVSGGAATQSTYTQSPVQATASPAPLTDDARTKANVPMPELTTEERAALVRRSSSAHLAAARANAQLVRQRAFRDHDEQAFRAPTAAEAAALAVPAGADAAQEIALPMGGYALKTDASGVSLAVATVGKDGVAIGHGDEGGHRDR